LDYNTTASINSTGAIPVQSGTVNTTTSWLLTSTVTTIGTDALTYVQFSINPTTIVTNVTGASGITSSGGQTPAISLTTISTNHALCNNSGGTTTPNSVNCTVTGTGNLVLATSPTLTTPLLGTPTSGVMTNVTGLPIAAIVNGTAGGLVAGGGSGVAPQISGAGTAKQVAISGGAGAPSFISFPDVKVIPAANCVAAVAGGGWSNATSNFTAACRAGTNNLGGALQAIPSSGAAGQFLIELPLDWDTAQQPYINIFYGSGANTTGTVIWTVSSSCSKADGSVTDDTTFTAESAFGSQTMAAANRMWSKSGQYTGITSGNSCIPGGSVIMKMAVSGTAASAINAYQAIVTIPRLLTVQGN
jgi:hypothetical protein